MSYDVEIGADCHNYTYNLARLFHDHISHSNETGLQSLFWLTGKQASRVLSVAIAKIEALTPEQLAAYNSPNGWGSGHGALGFLRQVAASCAKHPRHRVRVC